MYNGVGVPTARGTGTNGYVQKNMSFIAKPVARSAYNDKDRLKKMLSHAMKEPNEEIIEHERKRKLEVQCVEYEMELEEQGLTSEEINVKVEEKRKQLWDEYYEQLNKTVVVDGEEINYKVYMENLENEAKNKKMRKAFGLNENHERSSFFGQEKPPETGLPPPSRGLIENNRSDKGSPNEKLADDEMNEMLSSSSSNEDQSSPAKTKLHHHSKRPDIPKKRISSTRNRSSSPRATRKPLVRRESRSSSYSERDRYSKRPISRKEYPKHHRSSSFSSSDSAQNYKASSILRKTDVKARRRITNSRLKYPGSSSDSSADRHRRQLRKPNDYSKRNHRSSSRSPLKEAELRFSRKRRRSVSSTSSSTSNQPRLSSKYKSPTRTSSSDSSFDARQKRRR